MKVKKIKSLSIYKLIKDGACDKGIKEFMDVLHITDIFMEITENSLNAYYGRLAKIDDCIGFLERHGYISLGADFQCQPNDKIYVAISDDGIIAVLFMDYVENKQLWRWRLVNRPWDRSYNYPKADMTQACAVICNRFRYWVFEVTEKTFSDFIYDYQASGRKVLRVQGKYKEVTKELEILKEG
jgi:hypothetical protein